MALEKATATVSNQQALSTADKDEIKATLGYEDSAQLDARDAADRDRANHTGTQAISTIVNLQTELDGKADLVHTHDASDIISGVISYDRLPIDPTEVSNWNTAYGWGDHADAGYLTGNSYYSALESGVSIVYGNGTPSPLTVTTAQKGMAFQVGQGVTIYQDNFNIINGEVDSYNPTTGVLTVEVLDWIGNGTYLSQNSYVTLGISGKISKKNQLLETASTSIPMAIDGKKYYIRTTSSSTQTLTITTSISSNYRVGERITIIQGGTGRARIVAGSGVTVYSYEGDYTFGQHAAIEAIKLDTNVWNLIGGTTL